MAEWLYGTPVDSGVIAVRAAPETPLIVYPMEQAPLAQVFLAQPASWPALSSGDRAELSHYFEWEDREAYWWYTLRPAVVSLEQVSAGLWAGRLVDSGIALAAGNDPAVVPEMRNVARVQLAPVQGTIRDPHGPNLDASADVVLRSASMRVVEAYFATVEPSAVWLRLFEPGAERQAHLTALNRELTVNRIVALREPSLVPTILHEGRLETLAYSGRYVAMERKVGLRCSEALLATGSDPWSSRETIIRDVTADVLRLMMVAHAEGYCLGPLSPGLLRVRPSFSAWRGSGGMVAVAMPGAGPADGRVPPSVLELFPEGQADHLVRQFERPYRRSVEADLRALGHLVSWMLEIALSTHEELSKLALALMEGRVREPSGVLASLHQV
jgi:hypothetical protein